VDLANTVPIGDDVKLQQSYAESTEVGIAWQAGGDVLMMDTCKSGDAPKRDRRDRCVSGMILA
jgi:hypothetical protein